MSSDADPTKHLALLFTHEVHAVECGGRYYNPGGVIGYHALCNYLWAIPRGVVVLRCRGGARAGEGWLRVDGEGVGVHAIPEFGSPTTMIKRLPALVRALWSIPARADRYVLRLPGPTGMLVGLTLLLRGRRYGVEVAGHYGTELEKLIASRGLGPRWISDLLQAILRFLIGHAATASYRSHHLRRLYPTLRQDREWVFSGAQLSPEIITGPRNADHFRSRPFRIVSIGRIAQSKEYPLLVRAFARTRERAGDDMTLEIIGDGDDMPSVRREVERLGLQQVVSLPGKIRWGSELFARLDDAHLFVLASLAEGIPRSVIEAMARGMPVVSTRAGGIPELVDDEYLVLPGDEEALVEKIVPLVGNPSKLAEMSQRSFERSKEHWPQRLNRAKRGFWNCVIKYAR